MSTKDHRRELAACRRVTTTDHEAAGPPQDDRLSRVPPWPGCGGCRNHRSTSQPVGGLQRDSYDRFLARLSTPLQARQPDRGSNSQGLSSKHSVDAGREAHRSPRAQRIASRVKPLDDLLRLHALEACTSTHGELHPKMGCLHITGVANGDSDLPARTSLLYEYVTYQEVRQHVASVGQTMWPSRGRWLRTRARRAGGLHNIIRGYAEMYPELE